MIKRIIVLDEPEQLSELVGKIMTDITVRAIDERGKATVLVSGGNSVWRAYEAYGRSKEIDWTKVFFFWGDDRFVEPENPYSNYGLVRDALFAHAKGLPTDNVFPIPYDSTDPRECAEKYSRTIKEFFGIDDQEWPVFDLAQNGMGPDGHTASIFPHTPAVTVDDKIAVMNHAGLKPWVDRITLTLPVFNHCRNILFIAGGANKADILKTVLEGSPSIDEAPAAHILPEQGTLLWVVDKAAAAKLTMEVESSY